METGAGVLIVRGKVERVGLVTLLIFGIILSACNSSKPVSGGLTPMPVSAIPTTSSVVTSVPAPNSCLSSIDVGEWSDGRLASQMIAISSEMGTLADISQAVSDGVGGVVLMGNGSSPALKIELAKMRSLVSDGVSPLVMTDEEGGGIQPLSALVGSMPWPRMMAKTMSPGQVESLTYRVGQALRSVGVNMDLAPVVDLDAGPGPSNTNPDGSRSFSVDPPVADRYAKAFEAGLEKAGVIPVIKHFPGLGGASGNTDFAIAHTLSYSTLLKGGLIPFQRLASTAKVVMVSNASIPGLTGGVPSSLSPNAIRVLRSVVGFNGVIISDSLETISISSFQPDLSKAVVASAEAGVDLVMLASSNPNQVPIYQSAKRALARAIATGVLPRGAAEASVGRILVLKGFAPSCIHY